MIIKAALKGERIAEAPVTLSPDLRDRPPHLRPWRDGWRHLRYLLMLSPTWVFAVPATFAATLSLAIWAIAGVATLLGIQDASPFGNYWIILAGSMLGLGHTAALLAAATHLYGRRHGYRGPSVWEARVANWISLETMLGAGGLIFMFGLAILFLYQVSESLTPEADSRIGIYLIHHGKQLLGEFAMSTPVPLRSDFDTIGLRMLARRSRDPDQTRRLLALAEIYDGGSRPDAARIGGVGVQIVRDWVVRFNAKGPDGLLTGKAPGAPSILGERQRQALRQVVEDGPIPALHGVVRWRLIDLAQWLFEEFRVSISKPTLSRELRHMGFRKLSARPRHHAQDEEAAAAFKKTFSPSWRRPPQKRLLASR